MKLTVEQLAEQLRAELIGRPKNVSCMITAVAPIETAGRGDVTFLADTKRKAAVEKSNADAVIVSERIDDLNKLQLIVKDVNSALIEVLTIFAPKLEMPVAGIAATAVVAEDAYIAEGVSIGPGVVIEKGVQIGENSIISSGCKIGQNTKIGQNSRLDCNVVIYHNCYLGKNVIIQANTTIGSTGFGYTTVDKMPKLIPHNGGVIIEDFVEIGANCCIDRAKFSNTIIGAGTKIDNLVQIAHNVIVGKCCIIAGQVGISGSAHIGDGVVLAGQVGLVDNIEIGAGTQIGAKSAAFKSTPAGKKMLGIPAIEMDQAKRVIALTKRLPKMAEQLRQLNDRIEKLETAEDHKE